MTGRTRKAYRAGEGKRGARGRAAALQAAAVAMLFALTLLIGAHAYGQVTGLSTVSGLVTGSSGAAVANAKLVVTNVETNVARTSTTNSSGYFEVDNLVPGKYKIEVSVPGGDTLVRDGVILRSDARILLPLQLAGGGSIGSTIEPLLNKQTGSTGQVLSAADLEKLPMAAGNPMQLASLTPGMQAPYSQIYAMGETLSKNSVSKFGSAGFLNGNAWSIDGAPNMADPRGNAVQLSVSEIGELKIDPLSFDAAAGHTMGATIVATTKWGGNGLHGSIDQLYQDRTWSTLQHFQRLNYQYLQWKDQCPDENSYLPCVQMRSQYGIPSTHANIGAYSLSGPVVLPHVYDGRNKLFFFVNFNNDAWTDAPVKTTSIPTMLEQQGNFTDFTGWVQGATNPPVPAAYVTACGANAKYYGVAQLYNPFNVTLDSNGNPVRAPICGNTITAAMLQPNSALVSLYNSLLQPPTQAGVNGSNYSYTNFASQNYRQVTNRMDYAVSPADHAYFRWTRSHYENATIGFTMNNTDQQVDDRWIDQGVLGYDHVFSARTDVAVTAAASSWKTACCTYPGYEKYSPSTIGMPASFNKYAGAAPTLPVLNVANYQQVGAINSAPALYRDLSFAGVANHIRGAHSIRVGGEWRQQSFSQGAQGNTSGTYNFDDTYTQQNNGTNSTYAQSNWGLSYAAFLLGVPTSASVSQGYPVSIRTPYAAVYGVDSWRVNSKLTVVPGVRFEYEYGPAELRNAQIVGWDANATLPIASDAVAAYQSVLAGASAAQQAVMPSTLVVKGGPTYAGVKGASTRQFQNSYRILPRISASYELTPKTVLRGGYGIFFDTINAHDASNALQASLPGGAWGGAQFAPNQDGYSASTSTVSSTTFGTNFTSGTTAFGTLFPTVNGSQFNAPVGNAAGAMYYLGANPTVYDHNLVPVQAQRYYLGVQHQFGADTMVELAWVGSYAKHIALSQNMSSVPKALFAGGTTPNVASNTLLNSPIKNPFNIANFGDVAAANAAGYSLMQRSPYYTATTTNLSNLLRPYPQMGGLTEWRAVGLSHFNEFQINATKHYGHGLTAVAGLQINDQHDADYFANPFDAAPSWEPSNNSAPYRATVEAVYDLPLGEGKMLFRSGRAAKIAGGFQLAGSYERQPGALLQFSNLFFLGTPSKDIKLKHPIYSNNQASGGYNAIQWLNIGNVVSTYANGTCTNSGTGFVTNPNCQPNAYNLRAFPQRINGVRQQTTDTVQMSLQRNFQIAERINFQARCDAYNLLNRQVLAAPILDPTASNFGQVVADGNTGNGGGNARWITIQGRLRF